jgi:4-alpha-glucanotransferase
MRKADILRIDHFTGLAHYYEIDGSAESASEGVWRDGPGAAFFESMQRRLGALDIIVEDLGPLGDVVEDLRRQLGYPGMKILQEAFDGHSDNQFLPENYSDDCVVYTGTHDNDTARGRLDSESEGYRRQALTYTGASPETYPWALISRAWESVAIIAITPMQDLLDLGSEARMNYPSTIEGNWQWRMADGAASSDLSEKLGNLNRRTGRSR